MKKVFCILSILTIISPTFADDIPTPVPGDPGSTVAITDQTKAANVPGYNLINSHDETDGNAASAGYVKGAYNATIKAVNMVADQKQNKLGTVAPDKQGKTNGDIFHDDAGLAEGHFVTSVAAANGVVTVTRNEVTIPVGEPSGTAPATVHQFGLNNTQTGVFLCSIIILPHGGSTGNAGEGGYDSLFL